MLCRQALSGAQSLALGGPFDLEREARTLPNVLMQTGSLAIFQIVLASHSTLLAHSSPSSLRSVIFVATRPTSGAFSQRAASSKARGINSPELSTTSSTMDDCKS